MGPQKMPVGIGANLAGSIHTGDHHEQEHALTFGDHAHEPSHSGIGSRRGVDGADAT